MNTTIQETNKETETLEPGIIKTFNKTLGKRRKLQKAWRRSGLDKAAVARSKALGKMQDYAGLRLEKSLGRASQSSRKVNHADKTKWLSNPDNFNEAFMAVFTQKEKEVFAPAGTTSGV